MSKTSILPSSQALANTLTLLGSDVSPYTASSCLKTSSVAPLYIERKNSNVNVMKSYKNDKKTTND